MKKTALILAFMLACALGLRAQTTQITASNIAYFGGAKVTGRFCLTPTNQNGQAINITTPSGQQISPQVPLCFTVANGALSGSAVVPDTSLTNPVNACYLVTVYDNAQNQVGTYPCVQPTGSTWSFDSYVPSSLPSIPALTLPQFKVNGVTNATQSVLNFVGSGVTYGAGGVVNISGGSVDTRPRATTSAVGVTVAANASCVLSISPATAGQQSVAACNTGSPSGPGTITGIHLTLGPGGDGANLLQNSTISFNCDGETRTAPLGTFFLTQDNPKPFSNDWIQDSLGSQSVFSANRRMELNYTSGCTVTFVNASNSSAATLFGEVSYRLGANVSRASRQYWHMYSLPSTSLAHYANLQILPTVHDIGGGELESITLWTNSATNTATLEGYTTVTIDGIAEVQANGTEDFFGSGYFAVNSVGGHQSQQWGEFYSSAFGGTSSLQNPAGTYDALLFRNFQTDDRDNAPFASTLSAFQPNGENGKPGASDPGTVNMASLVTFWTHDPMAQPVTYSPGAGGVSSGTTVTLSTTTSGATICYTTDGSAPTANGAGTCTHGTAGSSAVVNPPETLTALATKSGYADSLISSAAYTSSGATGYTFSTNVFANNGGTSATFATTPAVTLSASDFAFVWCQGPGTGSTPFTVTSSISNTWNALTHAVSGSDGNGQGFYASGFTAGSSTFTCTTNSSGPFLQATVMVYHVTTASGVPYSGTDVSSNSCSSVTTCTSTSFSTTGPALVIYCGQINGTANWTAGSIGGTTATLRSSGSGSTGSPTFTGTNPVCEDAQFTTAQTGITSGITQSTGSAVWLNGGAAFH